jgi:hypothetical protein
MRWEDETVGVRSRGNRWKLPVRCVMTHRRDTGSKNDYAMDWSVIKGLSMKPDR